MPPMQGMDLRSIKRHPSLIPIYGVVFFGYAIGIFILTRTAIKCPDISWNKKKNPEPWQEYANKSYKLYEPAKSRGWKTLPRPKSIFWN